MSIFNGKPDLVIGPPDNPVMLRWHLLKYRDWPRIYVHKILRSDDDRAPHDHPWWFFSFLFWGGYYESRVWQRSRQRRAPSIGYSPLETQHRLRLVRNRPAWTLVVTGKDVRGWGFWCRRMPGYSKSLVPGAIYDDFIPWREFDGCGE